MVLNYLPQLRIQHTLVKHLNDDHLYQEFSLDECHAESAFGARVSERD